MVFNYWRWLDQTGSDLLLTVDFDAGKGTAGFRSLAGNMECSALEGLPLRMGTDLHTDSDPVAYVSRWADDLTAAGRPASAVLGHCAGAALACELAKRLRSAGHARLPVILFDPMPVSARTLLDEFDTALTAFVGHVDTDLVGHSRQEALDRSALSGAALIPLATELTDSFRVAVGSACRRLGVQQELEFQLCDRFSDYLGYLVSAARSTAEFTDPGVTIALSRDDPYIGDGIRRFDTASDQFLADPEVAEFVAKIVFA